MVRCDSEARCILSNETLISPTLTLTLVLTLTLGLTQIKKNPTPKNQKCKNPEMKKPKPEPQPSRMSSKRKLAADGDGLGSSSSSSSSSSDELFLGQLDGDDAREEGNRITVVLRARDSRKQLSSATDFRSLRLRTNHANRPLWVCPNGHIYLETTSKHFQLATDFLVAIAEPVSRPELVHHYKLTPYSLYAAVSVNLDTETILNVLERFAKTPLPNETVTFVRKCTSSFGKAKLVLKKTRLLVESAYPEVLQTLLTNETIKKARIGHMSNDSKAKAKSDSASMLAGASGANNINGFGRSEVKKEDKEALATDMDALNSSIELRLEDAKGDMEEDDEEDDDDDEDDEGDDESMNVVESRQISATKLSLKVERKRKVKREKGRREHRDTVVNFEIDPDMIEKVKEQAIRMDYPLMEEYDFRNDTVNPDLPITLKAKLRPYQEKSLSKMFGNGRARSGLIVLPCGAGKTLTGITACSTIKKSCIVMCSSGVAVEQWIREFKTFTNIKDEYIRRFTKDAKDDLHPSGATLLVTTYFILSYSRKRNERSQAVINQIKNTDWGLILMDEVHVVPAKMFRKALVHVKSHCKLGLTATLVREDDLIEDLNFLIGPKLYEANWLKLTEQGFLANVLCAEVWCPMTGEFFRQYLRETNAKRKQLLYVMNPEKYRVCKLLLEYHESQNDKILIFSDNIPALLLYARKLGKYCMYGDTSQREREILLKNFRGDGDKEINVLIISSVGDVAIDLPKCNIIIQISSHFGSRRQEAQRLGRILRPKSSAKFNVGYNAFFYR